ncbi:MAG: hypothetical protein JWL76_1513 [Thermoleophilia bacterium]|nr:hypothetical protein [Thermoleophilia bacterium]
MLVRAGNDGEWLQLTPVDGMPSGGLRSLCGADAANLLELDSPLPVAAYGPWPAGSLSGVDAVCLTETGDIELLVGTWGEEPRDTLWRLLDVAGTLRGTSLEVFASHLTELAGETSVTRWLHQRVGGDATQLEARLREVLETGDFGFVLVTSNGAGDLAQPLQFVQQGSTRIRVFEVEVLRAGDVQAIEGIEVPLAGTGAAAPATSEARAAVESAWQTPTLTVVPEPTPEPMVEPRSFERDPEAFGAETSTTTYVPRDAAPGAASVEAESSPAPFHVAEVAPEVEPEVEPQTFFEEPEADELPAAPEDPSDVDAYFRAVDRLDHRTSAHLRWLHDALLRLVDEAEYTTDGDRQFLTGWMHGTERLPLFLIDSRGLLQLVIASLPEHEQREYADEIAGMLPETSGSMLLKAGYADVDVPAHLDDQTLLEYLVDNLVEALPGGREAFGTHTPVDVPEQSESVETAEHVDGTEATTPLVEHSQEEHEPEAHVDEDSAEHSSGDDFFAGVSGSHDASDVETAVAGLGGQKEAPVAEADDAPTADVDTTPEREWAEPANPKSGSRWLRRRGAA